MDRKYSEWILAKLATGAAYGNCAGWTKDMAAAFPELTRVRGHYFCYAWGERAHWWLTTPDGELIDPTASQFPSKGTGHYEPLDETAPQPTGKCMDCGAYCFNGDSFCSAECERATRADMGI